jgi:hypothetical protein
MSLRTSSGILQRLGSAASRLPRPVVAAVDAVASLRRARGVENTAADLLMGFGLLFRLRLREARALTPHVDAVLRRSAAPRVQRRAVRPASVRAPRQRPVVAMRDDGELRALERLAAWSNAAYANSPAGAAADAPRGARIIAGPFEASELKPAFLVGYDDELRACVVSVRGSEGWGEALISLQAVPVAVAGGTAHRGMLCAADALVARLRAGAASSQLPPLATLLSDAPPGTALVFTGHSLGASVAALAALRLQTAMPASPTCAVAFCAPPCVSPAVARSMRAYVTSVVHGDDAVPRMHLHAIRRLRAELSRVDWAMELARVAAPRAVAAPAAALLRSIGRGLAAIGRALPRGSRAATLNVIDAARRVAAALRSAVGSVRFFMRHSGGRGVVAGGSAQTTYLSESTRATGSALAAASAAAATAATTLISEASRNIFAARPAPARRRSGDNAMVDHHADSSVCAYGGELDAITGTTAAPAHSHYDYSDLVHTIAGQIVWLAYPDSRARGPLPLLLRERGGSAAAVSAPAHALPSALSALHSDAAIRVRGGGRHKPMWSRKLVRAAFSAIAARIRKTSEKGALLDKVAAEAEAPVLVHFERVAWPYTPLQLLEVTPYTFKDHPISRLQVALRSIREDGMRRGER